MTDLPTSVQATWLTPADELPHARGEDPLWCENYLAYVHSPDTGVSIYLHLCRLPWPGDQWDEVVYVVLPDGRVLAAKSISPPRADGPMDVTVNGVSIAAEQPFERIGITYTGAARLVDAAELDAGPLTDGLHVPLDFRLTATAMSPPYDFGGERIDQEWAHGHYEQHMRLEGELRYGDEPPIAIAGTGLRDHSWGPRDYEKIGTTTWLHAQFPESGRHLMAVRVTGIPPKPEFTLAVCGDGHSVEAVATSDLPLAATVGDALTDYELELDGGAGRSGRVVAEVLAATRCGFLGKSQLVVGNHHTPDINHDYIDGFTKFTWDGEVGYGITERSVDRTAAAGTLPRVAPPTEKAGDRQ